jgi:hypothetical protein
MNKIILIVIGAVIVLIGIYLAFPSSPDEVIPPGTCVIDDDCDAEKTCGCSEENKVCENPGSCQCDKGTCQYAITNFQECIDAGYPAMESYPRQCAVPGGDTFTEILEEELIELDQ